MVDIATLVNRLLALPQEIEDAERALIAARQGRSDAEDTLADLRYKLLFDPERINGKNAEQREAQLLYHTYDARMSVDAEAKCCEERTARLHRLQNELSALRAVARLIGGRNL